MLVAVAVAVLALAVGCQQEDEQAGGPTRAQPYAGLESRPIKALSPKQVADLLAGRGAGYALPAELNRYPGPMHVLELAGPLELRPDQRAAVVALRRSMHVRAKTLGRQLVALHEQLERAFRSGLVTPDGVATLSRRIALVEGALRSEHLEAHVATRRILTPVQVQRYHHLRGYGGTPGGGHDAHQGHAG